MFKPVLISSYNTRWALGSDGVSDTARIVNSLSANGVPDIICLQEVSVGPTGLEGLSTGPNQVAQYRQAFPDHMGFFSPSMSRSVEGKEAHFGNLLLTRLPVEYVRYESLPAPEPETVIATLPRVATAVTMRYEQFRFTVVNTHLEYYSLRQRRAQIDHLRRVLDSWQTEGQGNELLTEKADSVFLKPGGCGPVVLCGDLNCEPNSPELLSLTQGIEGDPKTLRSVWSMMDVPERELHTVGLHSGYDWPERSYCCDYFLVSEAMTDAVVEAWVDQKPDCSDHQPIYLRINCAGKDEEAPAFFF